MSSRRSLSWQTAVADMRSARTSDQAQAERRAAREQRIAECEARLREFEARRVVAQAEAHA